MYKGYKVTFDKYGYIEMGNVMEIPKDKVISIEHVNTKGITYQEFEMQNGKIIDLIIEENQED